MVVRGVRGAITVAENTREGIHEATSLLINTIIEANELATEDIASAFFTVTVDLNADFPARAARNLGWIYVPMICNTEIAVPGSLEKTIRILLLINTTKSQVDIKHIYLRGAAKLRPDL